MKEIHEAERQSPGNTKSKIRPKLRNSQESNNRGVSDTLAFVITFSIIITSVGLVYGVGFSSLQDIRDGQQGINTQQAFETFGTEVNDLRDKSVPSRSTRLELRGGSLDVDTHTNLIIEVNDSKEVFNENVGAITYQSKQTMIGYESGATFGRYNGDSVMNAGPQFQCNPKTSVLSLVVIKSGAQSIGSSGTVEITATKVSAVQKFPEGIASQDGVDNVTVTVSDSPFQEAWISMFEDGEEWSHVAGNEYKCQTDQVYVKKTVIEVEFES